MVSRRCSTCAPGRSGVVRRGPAIIGLCKEVLGVLLRKKLEDMPVPVVGRDVRSRDAWRAGASIRQRGVSRRASARSRALISPLRKAGATSGPGGRGRERVRGAGLARSQLPRPVTPPTDSPNFPFDSRMFGAWSMSLTMLSSLPWPADSSKDCTCPLYSLLGTAGDDCTSAIRGRPHGLHRVRGRFQSQNPQQTPRVKKVKNG